MLKTKFIRFQSDILFLLQAGLVVGLVMTLVRILMVILYGDRWIKLFFLNPIQNELWKAFWLGARFDLTVISYLLLTVFILIVLPRLFFKKYLSPIGPLYILTLILFLISVCDLGYYSYFQDHLNILVFAFFEDDTIALIKLAWKNYPIVWFFILGLIFCILWFKWFKFRLNKTLNFLTEWHNKNSHSFIHNKIIHFNFFIGISFVVVFSVGARGGFGLFPLGPQDTVISSDPFINYLTYNGAQSLYRAFKLKKSQTTNWDANAKYFGYSDFRKAFADYFEISPDTVPQDPLDLLITKTADKSNSFQKPHVVLIVMESLGAYWLKFHSDKFNLLGQYEKHIQQDIFTTHFLPATNSTIGSLGALLAGVTHRPEGAFLTESNYLQVPFRTSPAKNFKSQGYTTRFIYGGNPGWRDVNKFALHQGFDLVEGEVDIEKKLLDHHKINNLNKPFILEKHDWGIFDEDLFKYIEIILQQATTPEFLVVMTTTNHPPYQLPSRYLKDLNKNEFSKYKDKLSDLTTDGLNAESKALPLEWPKELLDRLIIDKKLALERFKTYQYSNDQLGRFLNNIKSSQLGSKTIIASTADHGFMVVNFEESETLQKWNVPFYLYVPKKYQTATYNQVLKNKSNLFGSHIDIWPTLYELSLSNAKVFRLGDDLLNQDKTVSMSFHSSRVAFDPFGGIYAGKDQEVHYYKWKNPEKTEVEINNANEASNMGGQRLARRYKALNSLMDYYLNQEKKSQSKLGIEK